MRICCTVTNDLNYDQRMIRICSSLAEAGHRVTLVGRELGTSPDLAPRSFSQKRLVCWFNRGPAFYLEYNIRLFVYMIRCRPEAINTIDLDTVPAALLYRILARFKWFFDAHEHFTEVPEVTNRKLVKQIWKMAERLVFRFGDVFYTVSGSISDLYHKKYKKKVEVIRNVPFLRSYNVVKPHSDLSEQGTIIYQGALNEGRCIELYLEAMRQLNARLVLVGEGDLSNKLRKLAQEYEVADKVVFKGKLEPEELWHLTQSAHMGLNVLENKGLSYYYSLSNKCFDYVQAHIPSISSDFPEYQNLNREHETMLLVQPELSQVVQAMKTLLEDPAVYRRLKENCKQAAEEWNWNTEEKKLLALYG